MGENVARSQRNRRHVHFSYLTNVFLATKQLVFSKWLSDYSPGFVANSRGPFSARLTAPHSKIGAVTACDPNKEGPPPTKKKVSLVSVGERCVPQRWATGRR